MKMWILALTVFLVSCVAPPKTEGILAPNCGPTAVSVHDVEALGFHPDAGKVVVLRVFASWCPYCKADLVRMGEMFRNRLWTPAHVQILLLAYHNHGENRASFEQFKQQDLAPFGLPPEALQLIYLDQDRDDLVKTKNAKGVELFKEWKGLPFSLVFATDGRMAFRGHFTMSDRYQENHYRFIEGLQRETCGI